METLLGDAGLKIQGFAPATAERSRTVRPEKFLRLPQIDREHAASLTRSCSLSNDAKTVSRKLAAHSLLQSSLTSLPLVVSDFVTMWTLLFVSTAIVERVFQIPTNLVTRQSALIASLLLIPIARLKGLYPAIGTSPVVEFKEIVQSAATALCIFAGIGIATNASNWPYLIASVAVTFVFAVPAFPASRYLVRGVASRFSWWGSPVLVYANVDAATELFRRLSFIRQRGLRPAGVLLSKQDFWNSSEQLAEQGIPAYDVRQVLECASEHHATWLLIGTGGQHDEEIWGSGSEIQADINAIPNRVLLTSGGFDCGMWDRTHTIGTVTGLWLSSSRHCYSQAVIKRFVDIFVTTVAVIMLAPVLAGIALAIKLSSPGPILYSQKRLGRGGQLFSAWKFRSMVPNADRVLKQVLESDPELRREWDETHKLKRDPRVTWIGRLIRATSLDELPQLWNIFCGDMSLVGPRPIVDAPTYDAAYIRDYPTEYAAYCSVRPGLTGLWQVTCRNSGVYEMRIFWDIYYIRNWSLWLDLYIILRTIRTVLLREGAY